MFASLSRFRRLVAVLSALALMASVLAAAPAVAADDPKRTTRLLSVPARVWPRSRRDFEDVPANHTNAGDIDCIAYYGITMGTGDGSTYSPSMSVTREQMALFLTRLADVVGIEMASDPSDAGFTDIGELSADSQTRINQLADLDITVGTGDGTYSPAGSVTRGQMALFIARLMDKMDPFADPNAPTNADPFAYIPKQVKAVADDTGTADVDETVKVGSPFTDLDRTTKEAYDAITELWELGVASGISSTAYGPSALMTRASMADFMAGVLDHSNARPAGVTMQVTKTTGFGEVRATRAISVRDDSFPFAPVADVSVKVFRASESGGIDDDTGKCLADDVCDWSDNDEITNDHGNNFEEIVVDTTINGVIGGAEGNVETSDTWYAWMGSEDNSEFVKGSSGEAMVTLTAKANALGVRVTADIAENATNYQVDVGKDRTVVLTAQLVDQASDSRTINDANAVAKEGVTLAITRTRGAGNPADRPGPADMKTDADGKVTFTIMGPEDDGDTNNVTEADTVTFQGDYNGDGNDGAVGTFIVNWSSAVAAVAKGVAETDAGYTIVDDGKVRIVVTMSYYDQYGNPAAGGDSLGVTVNNPDDSSDDGQSASGAGKVRVRSNGTARYIANLNAKAGAEITVVITQLTRASTIDAATAGPVLAVSHAHKNDDGVSGNRAAGTENQVIVDADNDRFIIDTGAADTDVVGVLYSYDSNDTFIIDNNDVDGDIDKFEEAIATNGKTVTVVVYSPDPDGVSIFTVKDTSSGG